MSYRIMKTHDFQNGSFYRASCDCGSPDCDLTLEFERDSKLSEMIFLNMYKDLYWSSSWGDPYWHQRMWKRLTAAFRILFIGYVKVEESFVFSGKDHIMGFMTAMDEGLRMVMEKEE